MNLKTFAKQSLCKEAALAAKITNYAQKATSGMKKMTTKPIKGPGNLTRKLNPTTPYGMV